MGPGEEVQARPEPNVEILEKGEMFFFYRPKVDKEEAQGPDDVQRIYIVLRPESGKRPVVEEKQTSDSGKEGRKQGQSKEGGGNNDAVEGGRGTEEVDIEKQPLLRLIVMGKKSLPDPSERSRPFWGFVELVTTKVDDIKTALKGGAQQLSTYVPNYIFSPFRGTSLLNRYILTEKYDTATRGHRHRPPARALAEGVYRILLHVPSGREGEGEGEGGRRRRRRGQEHTHLIYKLEFPPSGGEDEPQESLNVEREASFLIQIKNPQVGRGDSGGGGFRGLQSKRRAAFPAHLQGQFGGKRFIRADPPDLLNYEGCEFLLISASTDNIEEELGLELKTECEVDAECSDLLQMFGKAASTKPLLSGTWV